MKSNLHFWLSLILFVAFVYGAALKSVHAHEGPHHCHADTTSHRCH